MGPYRIPGHSDRRYRRLFRRQERINKRILARAEARFERENLLRNITMGAAYCMLFYISILWAIMFVRMM